MNTAYVWLRAHPGSVLFCAFVSFLFSVNLHAWDATGHRLNASIAFDYLPAERRDALLSILSQHPRFAADFQERMPAAISRGNKAEQDRWLFGQAAIWPDVARGILPESEREKYNRANWHFIDGRWVPAPELGNSSIQGNVYVGMVALPDIHGDHPDKISAENQVTNMMFALYYSLRRLHDTNVADPERAIALCLVMHLLGDIHQPLHAGSMLSATLFVNGDRGGNAINTRGGNLHARWDQALSDMPFAETLEKLTAEAARIGLNSELLAADNSSLWLQESRDILQTLVYTDEMREAVLQAERSATELPVFILDAEYVAQMQSVAEQRLLLAGLRLVHALGDPAR